MSAALDALRRDFSGSIITSEAPEYDDARRTALAWGTPDLVVRPLDTSGVQSAVRFAVSSDLPLAVRGGGHSFAGLGTADAGVVVDLSGLAAVEVLGDEPGRVRVGGGATWGQVAAALAPHDLIISSGDTSSVGVGGLTLSGGIGWMVRRYGLAMDSLISAEVVTADGEILVADNEDHRDLFWAVRGGGGNFGIVTSFEFAAQPGTDVRFGRICFPADEVTSILPAWADQMRSAPLELTSIVNLANPFTGGRDAPVEIVVAVHGLDDTAADRTLDPLRRLGTVVADDVAQRRYADILVDGATLPPGFSIASDSAFVSQNGTAAAMDIVAEEARRATPPAIAVRSLGGAMSQIPRDATAFAHRSAELMIVMASAGPTAVVEAARPSIKAMRQRLVPHTDGAYPNFLDTATARDVAATYPEDTLRRLSEIKGAYDPGNVFARNHNVLPAPASSPALTRALG